MSMPIPPDLALPAPFIVGVGRSGTTLLRLMLDAHPDLAIPAETHFVPALIKAAEETQDPRAALQVLASVQTWPNLGLDLASVDQAFSALDPFSSTGAVRAVFRLYAEGQGKSRWGDKTPTYRAHLSEIARAVPEARFIHIIRDGRDVALSYRGLWFGPGDDIEGQARFWVDQIEHARAQAQHLPCYLELRFEDLVARPEVELERICRFLELPFDRAMLDYPSRARHRLSEYVQTFGPQGSESVPIERFRAIHERTQASPDAARIGRWKVEMSSAELRSYEQIAGPTLRALGYTV
jgi:Sulfotransferase family